MATENNSVTRSKLTEIELNPQTSDAYNLASGYPVGISTDWIKQITTDNTLTLKAINCYEKSNITSEALDKDLCSSVAKLLGITGNSESFNSHILPNGSIAINRAISLMSENNGYVIVSVPTFDVIAATIYEFANCSVEVVPAKEDYKHDVDTILKRINCECSGIALCSPENPTGAMLSSEDIYRITKKAYQYSVPVLFDQCFALVSGQDNTVELLANNAFPGSKWIMLWDTGKTFGLAHEKLGFLFSSTNISKDISRKIHILSFDVPHRTKNLFLNIFEHKLLRDYLHNNFVRLSYHRDLINHKLKNSHTEIFCSKSSVFAILKIDYDKYELPKEKLETLILDIINIVPLDCFYLDDILQNGLYEDGFRVALNRDSYMFEQSINSIKKFFEALQ